MVCPHTTMVCPHTHAARCGLDSPAPLHLHRESVCSSQPRRTEAQCRDVTWTQRTAGRNAGRRRQRSIYMATAEQRRSVRDATAQNQTHRRDSSLALAHHSYTARLANHALLIESLGSTTGPRAALRGRCCSVWTELMDVAPLGFLARYSAKLSPCCDKDLISGGRGRRDGAEETGRPLVAGHIGQSDTSPREI